MQLVWDLLGGFWGPFSYNKTNHPTLRGFDRSLNFEGAGFQDWAGRRKRRDRGRMLQGAGPGGTVGYDVVQRRGAGGGGESAAKKQFRFPF